MANNKEPFEILMEAVGNNGKFQKIYTWILALGTTVCGAMIYMNFILALNVPDHWCYVPGIEKTNFTIDKWKNLTLPVMTDNRGELKFSTCEMYNINISDILINENLKLDSPKESVACLHGYEYDREWYAETIPMKENWVCERDLYATNAFVISRVSDVLGGLITGQLGDIYGRRLIFSISVIATSIGRVVSILTTSSYAWFILASVIATMTMATFFLSPIVVAMEISTDDDRTTIAMVQSLGWSLSGTFVPLMFWWLKHYVPFMWLTTLPILFIIFVHKYLIESPRWLISKKRFSAAKKQFDTIAKINGKQFTISEAEMAKMFSEVKQEHLYGVASLFSSWKLAGNTIIMASSSCVVVVSYFTLVLFSSQMGGNPFINFLSQSIVEIPAYILGKYLADNYGRRATNSLVFITSGILCIPTIFLASDLKYKTYLIVLSTVIKFLNGITYFTACLQAMEIYPTCLRQTGQTLGLTIANGVGIMAPYFVYLGVKHDIRYPYYILAVLFFVGGCLSSFLPETLHQKLPDTLEDAKLFGRGQTFWSLPKRRKSSILKSEIEKLNQKQFVP